MVIINSYDSMIVIKYYKRYKRYKKYENNMKKILQSYAMRNATKKIIQKKV